MLYPSFLPAPYYTLPALLWASQFISHRCSRFPCVSGSKDIFSMLLQSRLFNYKFQFKPGCIMAVDLNRVWFQCEYIIFTLSGEFIFYTVYCRFHCSSLLVFYWYLLNGDPFLPARMEHFTRIHMFQSFGLCPPSCISFHFQATRVEIHLNNTSQPFCSLQNTAGWRKRQSKRSVT